MFHGNIVFYVRNRYPPMEYYGTDYPHISDSPIEIEEFESGTDISRDMRLESLWDLLGNLNPPLDDRNCATANADPCRLTPLRRHLYMYDGWPLEDVSLLTHNSRYRTRHLYQAVKHKVASRSPRRRTCCRFLGHSYSRRKIAAVDCGSRMNSFQGKTVHAYDVAIVAEVCEGTHIGPHRQKSLPRSDRSYQVGQPCGNDLGSCAPKSSDRTLGRPQYFL